VERGNVDFSENVTACCLSVYEPEILLEIPGLGAWGFREDGGNITAHDRQFNQSFIYYLGGYMKKVMSSILLLAVALTIVFPVIAFASSSAPMTVAEMKAAVGGKDLAACAVGAELARAICREAGGGYFTCLGVEIVALVGCILI
jgi:hypothetical protein